MGVEEKLPSGILLTTVEKVAGYARKSSVWPATFGLACCAIELMQTGGPRHDLARFGMERASNTPRQADLMIVAGRVSQKMAPVLRQIYDQMADPKWVISMGVCASSGGMFNNYAIVQGVDHVVPVDIYLPGCPPRPEMLLDAIMKLHDKIMNMKLGVNREREVTELEEARLRRLPLAPELAGSQSRTAAAGGPTLLGTPALPSPAVRSRNLGMTSAAGPHPAGHPDAQPVEARATEAQATEARATEARATEARATEAGAAGE
jgi:NADH-quinone oxidoreductase subunit B